MNRLSHQSLLLTLTTALIALIGVETADLATVIQQRFPETRELFERFHLEEERLARLTQQQEFFLASYAAREQAVEDMLAGRRTFLETAARFHELNQRKLPGMTLVGVFLPGATVEERACHQVIRWAESAVLAQSPAKAAPMRTALEDELRGQLECFGSVQLPAP